MSSKVEIQKYIDSLERQYKPRAEAATTRAIYKFANFILAEAKRLCPIDKGNLVASGLVEEPVGIGLETIVTIGFNMYYAAAVHEILTAHHPQGQAKYLETALRMHAGKLMTWVKQELEKEFGKS